MIDNPINIKIQIGKTAVSISASIAILYFGIKDALGWIMKNFSDPYIFSAIQLGFVLLFIWFAWKAFFGIFWLIVDPILHRKKIKFLSSLKEHLGVLWDKDCNVYCPVHRNKLHPNDDFSGENEFIVKADKNNKFITFFKCWECNKKYYLDHPYSMKGSKFTYFYRFHYDHAKRFVMGHFKYSSNQIFKEHETTKSNLSEASD